VKTLLHRLFLENWPRKATSILLAIIIWVMVDHTLTTSKTISNIPVKVINIPEGRTIQGLQPSGLLKRRVTVTLVGNKVLLDELSSSDLEIVIDATGKEDEWTPIITPKNLISLNPEIDIFKAISKVYTQAFSVRTLKLITEKIPIFITKPVGDTPRDYQFLDVWPYQLNLTVTAPEDIIKRLKAKEHRLTFNLNEITKAQLDALPVEDKKEDVVSFFVPEAWKQIHLPLLSDMPIEINDPLAKTLRIDFIRCELFSIQTPIPISLFFPQEYLALLNPETVKLAPGDFFRNDHGVYVTAEPFFAKGVSYLFLETVQNMLELSVIVVPEEESKMLNWSLQLQNPRHLENIYVAKMMGEGSSEEYLRNRFRHYMNHLQLLRADGYKWQPKVELQGSMVQFKY
jgi:hypothetical protein